MILAKKKLSESPAPVLDNHEQTENDRITEPEENCSAGVTSEKSYDLNDPKRTGNSRSTGDRENCVDGRASATLSDLDDHDRVSNSKVGSYIA